MTFSSRHPSATSLSPAFILVTPTLDPALEHVSPCFDADADADADMDGDVSKHESVGENPSPSNILPSPAAGICGKPHDFLLLSDVKDAGPTPEPRRECVARDGGRLLGALVLCFELDRPSRLNRPPPPPPPAAGVRGLLNESRREDDRMRVGMLRPGVSGREDAGENALIVDAECRSPGG